MPNFAKTRAAAAPDEIALRDPGQELTWTDVDDALNRCANLVLDADLGPANRVAVYAENAAETALAHLGALMGGAS